jgi:predicted ATP-dependent serine protease
MNFVCGSCGAVSGHSFVKCASCGAIALGTVPFGSSADLREMRKLWGKSLRKLKKKLKKG